MILLVGLKNDPIIHYVYKHLCTTDLPIAFVDQQYLGSDIKINDESIRSTKQNWEIEHSSIQAVINRLVGSPKNYIQEHYNHVDHLIHLLDDIYPNVLNRPTAGFSNSSKPFQTSLLKLNHLKIPTSYVHAGLPPPQKQGIIYKSISSIRSIVQHLEPCSYAVNEPVLFQDYYLGTNVRAHVLDQDISTTAIISSDLDYRYGQNTLDYNYDIPEKIKQECININKQLGLIFTGIDLIKTHKEWILLEVNPAPGYAFFEENNSSKPISQMIINYLKKIVSRSSYDFNF